jgi:hypothetical protein
MVGKIKFLMTFCRVKSLFRCNFLVKSEVKPLNHIHLIKIEVICSRKFILPNYKVDFLD